MAKIVKRGDNYYIEFYGNGLLFEKYAGPDEARAQKILKEIEDSLPEGAMSNVIEDQNIDSFLEEFLTAAKHRYSRLTYAQFADVAETLKRFLESYIDAEKLSKLTPKIIHSFQEQLNEGGSDAIDVNFQLFLVSCILDFAVKKGYLNDNATLHIPALEAPKPELLSEEGLNSLLSGASSDEKKIIEFLLQQAPPSEETKAVKWNDFENHELRTAFVDNLLKRGVPLFKIFELLDVDDIRELKPFVSLIPPKEGLGA